MFQQQVKTTIELTHQNVKKLRIRQPQNGWRRKYILRWHFSSDWHIYPLGQSQTIKKYDFQLAHFSCNLYWFAGQSQIGQIYARNQSNFTQFIGHLHLLCLCLQTN